MRRTRTFAAAAAAGGLALLLPPAAASAQTSGEGPMEMTAELAELNGSGASGTATLSLDGDQLTISVTSTGLSAELPHAQHIHIGGQGECPPPSASGDDDLITTAEGQPFYGGVQVSLTTEGDVGPGSALAVDRMPAAGADGSVTYQRTITLPDGVTPDEVMGGVIVQHGISTLYDDQAAYDGEARSSLDDSLPLEATIPATCGQVVPKAGGGTTPTTPPAPSGATTVLNAQLGAMNGSGVSGTATVSVTGDQATVRIQASGHSPGAPHAQHIHIGGQNSCPPASAGGDDGLVDTAEGQPFYGMIEVSLTTEGDVSPSSGLAVDRMPTAGTDGSVNYERTFTLPEGVTAADLMGGVIVQHGISELFEDPGAYDGQPRSPLDDSLPLEATIPAACGRLMAAGAGGGQGMGGQMGGGQASMQPMGGMDTGAGGTAGDSASPLVPAGLLTVAAGAGLAVATGLRRRRQAA